MKQKVDSVKYNHFEMESFFLSHKEYEAIYIAEKAEYDAAIQAGDTERAKQPLLRLSSLVSRCLHEDWRQNLINEHQGYLRDDLAKRGIEYDPKIHHIAYRHMRTVRDPELEAKILANEEFYLAQTGKINPDDENEPALPLYEIITSEVEDPNDKSKKVTKKEVYFDLLRMDYDEVGKNWQNANISAAKYAVVLIKKALEQGAFRGDPQKVFMDIEKLSHDIHIEWMEREKDWGNLQLFLPYELLTTAEQNKDTAQLLTIMRGLSFRSDILARNRAIVIRALKEVLSEYSDDDGIKKEIMNNIEAAQVYMDEYDEQNTQRCEQFKNAVKAKAVPFLAGKKELSFADLEKLSQIYYNEWKVSAGSVMELPKEYKESYENHPVSDVRLNFKNISRYEIADLISELVKDGLVNESLLQSAKDIKNDKSEIGKKIKNQNEIDFANYKAMAGGGNQMQ